MMLRDEIRLRVSNFFRAYGRKVRFIRQLFEEWRVSDEMILLTCCYIDQLGRCLFPTEGSSKRAFDRMLLTHSGEAGEFCLVSAGDLAMDVIWMAETASFTIPKPGRIQLKSDEDKPLVRFLDQSGVALTETAVRKLFLSLYEDLKANFRLHPYQTKKKNSFGDQDFIVDSIMRSPKLRRLMADVREDNVSALVKEYTYASILYREYRCKAVHEAAGIRVHGKRFWRSSRPYFVEWKSYLWPHTVYKLEFPVCFLIDCLDTCVNCAEKAVIGKGLLPLPIWQAVCDIEELEFLDIETLEEPRSIKLRID